MQSLKPRISRFNLFSPALLLAVLFFLFFAASIVAQRPVLIQSTAEHKMQRVAAPRFHPSTSGQQGALQLDDSVSYQTIDGFGASFLEGGQMAINTLPPAGQEKVFKSLFDPRKGAGFSAMKTVIGSTDFQSAGPYYTLDETPGDERMEHFSIQRDLGPNGLITYIRRARKYGNFKLQAQMDFPPDWIMFDAVNHQDVDPARYDALANYYLHYVRAYQEQGIDLDYVSLFNEPGIYTKINYAKIRDLLRDHVGPLFEREHMKTKLQISEAPTREDASANYPIVLDDPQARRYVGGLAYHGYDDANYGKIAQMAQQYPGLPLWMTEVCWSYLGSPPKGVTLPRYDWADNDYWSNMIFSDMEASASAWIYWNMVLNEKGGPWAIALSHGNPDNNVQHPLVVVNEKTHRVTYTAAFYAVAHFSKFVRPGAVRIKVTGKRDGVRVVAFRSSDGKIVAELLNSLEEPVTTSLEWRGLVADLTLPGRSISTIIWKAQSH